MADSKKLKHRCPPLPEELGKVTPAGWNGEDAAKAKAMWFAWLRIVAAQRPLARKTH
jgi:hypothetical protein